jgi:predicted AAA+ superfamily ATPase
LAAGSYLKRLYEEPNVLIIIAELNEIEMTSLSFDEFLDIFGYRGLYNSIDLYGTSPNNDYEILKYYFDLYLKCGGYPGVVTALSRHNTNEAIDAALWNVYNVFITESAPYFKKIEDRVFLQNAITGIASLFNKEKVGMAAIKRLDLLLAGDNADPNLLRDGFYNESLGRVISWLLGAHIVGECKRALNCKFNESSDVARYYFRDVGFANLILSQVTEHAGDLMGHLTETFAFLILRNMLKIKELFPKTPTFGTYNKGEIDFLIRNRSTDSLISLEVKYSSGEVNASKKALADSKINYIVIAQSKGPFGIDGRIITIPVYLLGRYKFELGVKITDAFLGKLVLPRHYLFDGNKSETE